MRRVLPLESVDCLHPDAELPDLDSISSLGMLIAALIRWALSQSHWGTGYCRQAKYSCLRGVQHPADHCDRSSSIDGKFLGPRNHNLASDACNRLAAARRRSWTCCSNRPDPLLRLTRLGLHDSGIIPSSMSASLTIVADTARQYRSRSMPARSGLWHCRATASMLQRNSGGSVLGTSISFSRETKFPKTRSQPNKQLSRLPSAGLHGRLLEINATKGDPAVSRGSEDGECLVEDSTFANQA